MESCTIRYWYDNINFLFFILIIIIRIDSYHIYNPFTFTNINAFRLQGTNINGENEASC